MLRVFLKVVVVVVVVFFVFFLFFLNGSILEAQFILGVTLLNSTTVPFDKHLVKHLYIIMQIHK